jgi:hypothetical protein
MMGAEGQFMNSQEYRSKQLLGQSAILTAKGGTAGLLEEAV